MTTKICGNNSKDEENGLNVNYVNNVWYDLYFKM